MIFIIKIFHSLLKDQLCVCVYACKLFYLLFCFFEDTHMNFYQFFFMHLQIAKNCFEYSSFLHLRFFHQWLEWILKGGKVATTKKKFENENFIQYLSRAFIFQVFVDAYRKRCLWCFLGLFYFRLERCCLHLMYNSMKILIKLFTGSKCVTIIP